MRPPILRAATWAIVVAALLACGFGCVCEPPAESEGVATNGRREGPNRVRDGPLEAVGEAGALTFSLSLQPHPPALGDLFTVVTTLTRPDGTPVKDAHFRLDARMPEHDHGMNTRPVHRPLGDGRYLTEGMRLHMPGRWVFFVTARSGAVSDRAEIVHFQPP